MNILNIAIVWMWFKLIIQTVYKDKMSLNSNITLFSHYQSFHFNIISIVLHPNFST